MVRQDKITYLITHFAAENGEFNNLSKEAWLDSYLSNNRLKSNSSSVGALVEMDNVDIIDDIKSMVDYNEIFISDVHSTRILYRIGVVQSDDNSKTSIDMSNFTPFGRSFLLFYNLHKLACEMCTAFNPQCNQCELTGVCDFYNEKNNWANS